MCGSSAFTGVALPKTKLPASLQIFRSSVAEPSSVCDKQHDRAVRLAVKMLARGECLFVDSGSAEDHADGIVEVARLHVLCQRGEAPALRAPVSYVASIEPLRPLELGRKHAGDADDTAA